MNIRWFVEYHGSIEVEFPKDVQAETILLKS